MTQTINNRRRNQKNRHKLAALAKKAKKERNQLDCGCNKGTTGLLNLR